LKGHGVIMEGNRKMTGCLQPFGGHVYNKKYKSVKSVVNEAVTLLMYY